MLALIREFLTVGFIGFILTPYAYTPSSQTIGLIIFTIIFVICLILIDEFWTEIEKMGQLANISSAQSKLVKR